MVKVLLLEDEDELEDDELEDDELLLLLSSSLLDVLSKEALIVADFTVELEYFTVNVYSLLFFSLDVVNVLLELSLPSLHSNSQSISLDEALDGFIEEAETVSLYFPSFDGVNSSSHSESGATLLTDFEPPDFIVTVSGSSVSYSSLSEEDDIVALTLIAEADVVVIVYVYFVPLVRLPVNDLPDEE